MKESIGYTVTLNIAITFIIIIFALFAMAISYYRAYKVGNVITHEIEKYEGYNSLSESSIEIKLTSLGYTRSFKKCDTGAFKTESNSGYCVYKKDDDSGYVHYKIVTNMMLNIPIINSIIKFPVVNNTKIIYNFTNNSTTTLCKAVTSNNRTVGNVPIGQYKYGDEYICNVDGNNNLHFFVVSQNSNYVSLILDHNLKNQAGAEEYQITPFNDGDIFKYMLNRKLYEYSENAGWNHNTEYNIRVITNNEIKQIIYETKSLLNTNNYEIINNQYYGLQVRGCQINDSHGHFIDVNNLDINVNTIPWLFAIQNDTWTAYWTSDVSIEPICDYITSKNKILAGNINIEVGGVRNDFSGDPVDVSYMGIRPVIDVDKKLIEN